MTLLSNNSQIVMNKSEIGKKGTPPFKKYSKIEPSNSYQEINWCNVTKKLILIGTSTGGPGALQKVLTKLPKDIGAPILIVQHMPSGFTASLANRLNSLSEIVVKEAEHGEVLQPGTAYIAPGGRQLRIKVSGETLLAQLQEPAERCIYCPSVDVLFESAASLDGYGKIAVIMTGMGSDGAKGLQLLKKTGSIKVIAQSQESCIVFGMPKAAIATGLVDDIESVENIAEIILKYV